MNYSVLRRIRITAAILIFALITVYFLDFAGVIPDCIGELAAIQLIPAILALNVVIIAILIIATLLFGRIYCSVICPLGFSQDIFNWIARKINKKNKTRFNYSRPMNWLRYPILGLMILAMIAGISVIAAALDPYSAFGRIVTDLFKQGYIACNNGLASLFGDRFYRMDYMPVNAVAVTLAGITLVAIAVLAWRNGRTYCNTICPAGTFLGIISRYSIFKISLDESSCNHCLACGKKCKASCIDSKNQQIDYSRCVVCFDCMESCKQHAIGYKSVFRKSLKLAISKDSETTQKSQGEDASRRRFLSSAVLAVASVPGLLAQEKTDTLIHTLTAREPVKRKTAVSPPGSQSHKNLNNHCTSCHLCISKCPNGVLRPALTEYGFSGVMQPVMSFEKGFCDYDCTLCSEVCPNDAIKPLTLDEKQGLQIGFAVFNKENCVVFTDDMNCGNCADHCPASAITMVDDPKDYRKFPVVEKALCIGCGSCEYHCPATPFSAIHVEGLEVHKA